MLVWESSGVDKCLGGGKAGKPGKCAGGQLNRITLQNIFRKDQYKPPNWCVPHGQLRYANFPTFLSFQPKSSLMSRAAGNIELRALRTLTTLKNYFRIARIPEMDA